MGTRIVLNNPKATLAAFVALSLPWFTGLAAQTGLVSARDSVCNIDDSPLRDAALIVNGNL
jgi:hypothetical protein